MSTRRLIVNADDFGRTPGVNAGVLEAWSDGIVTSATLMVNYEAAAEAGRSVREASRAVRRPLGVGLHIALTGGPLALPVDRVPSLLDAGGSPPARPTGHGALEPREVEAEVRAQLERFRDLVGAEPTHLDGHHHVHRRPIVCDVVARLAREIGCPVRDAGGGITRAIGREGVRTTDRFDEDFYDEGATHPWLLDFLRGLTPGVTELMCHPGRVDDQLRRGSGYVEARERETEILTDPAIRRAIDDLGIDLVHFGDLGPGGS